MSSQLILALLIAASFSTTEASAADLANNTGGPTTLTVGVPASFTMNAGINTLTLPASVQKKILITTSPNLGGLSALGVLWNCITNVCTRTVPAISAGSFFPQLTVTTTPTVAGLFTICGTISYIPNPSVPPDTFPANNQSCVSGTVKPAPSAFPPNLLIKKQLMPLYPATFPGTATFQIGVANTTSVTVGPGQAKVIDNLDPGAFTALVPPVPLSPGWNCGATMGLNVSCINIFPQASGAFPPITFKAITKMKGNFKNKASVTYLPLPGQPAETNLIDNTILIPFTIN